MQDQPSDRQLAMLPRTTPSRSRIRSRSGPPRRFAFIFLATISLVVAEPREWTSADGKTITAEFLGQDLDQVTVLKDGKRFRFSRSKLSPGDHQWLKNFRLDPAEPIVRNPVRLAGVPVAPSQELASSAEGAVVDVWFNRLPDEDGGHALRFFVQLRHPRRAVPTDENGRYPTPGYMDLTVLWRHRNAFLAGTVRRPTDLHILQWRDPSQATCHVIREFRFGRVPEDCLLVGYQVEFWDFEKKLYGRLDAPAEWNLSELKEKLETVRQIPGKNLSSTGTYGEAPFSEATLGASDGPERIDFHWQTAKD